MDRVGTTDCQPRGVYSSLGTRNPDRGKACPVRLCRPTSSPWRVKDPSGEVTYISQGVDSLSFPLTSQSVTDGKFFLTVKGGRLRSTTTC